MHVEHKHPKPTASCEAAPLWASNSLFLFREAGQTYQVKGVCNMPIEMATPKIEHKPYARHDDN